MKGYEIFLKRCFNWGKIMSGVYYSDLDEANEEFDIIVGNYSDEIMCVILTDIKTGEVIRRYENYRNKKDIKLYEICVRRDFKREWTIREEYYFDLDSANKEFDSIMSDYDGITYVVMKDKTGKIIRMCEKKGERE